MKKITFFQKLAEEGKLSESMPSEDVKDAYLERSDESLVSSKTLYSIGNLNDSVSLAYFSMYHCLLGLLYRIGIKSENHSASILLLKTVFDIDNRKISYAKHERIDKQYYIDFLITKDEVSETIKLAESFISEITDFIERLSESDIKNYHDKAVSLISKV